MFLCQLSFGQLLSLNAVILSKYVCQLCFRNIYISTMISEIAKKTLSCLVCEQLNYKAEAAFVGLEFDKVSKGAKIRNQYNQVRHLTQDTNGKVTNLQLDTTNESQEVSPFPAGDNKAHINRRSQRHSKHKTEKNKNIKDPQKKHCLGTVSKIFYWRA